MALWLAFLLLLSVAFIVVSTARFRLHPFLALILAAFGYGILSGMPLGEVIEGVTDGFGVIIGSIGIVILAGAMIGTFLEKSGGAYTLAERILAFTGERRVPLGMAGIGFVVSISVFCDAAFIVLSSLNRSLAKRAGLSLAVTAIALSLGLYATHAMVPPTPGPIAAAGILEADLGLAIVTGLAVAIPTMLAGWGWAVFAGRKIYIDPNPELSDDDLRQKLQEAPGAGKAFLPIIVPIALIVMHSIAELPAQPLGEGLLAEIVAFIGHPVPALLIGFFLALTLPRSLDASMLSSSGWAGEGILNGAVIIIITGAGGAFGSVLQESGIADVLGEYLVGANLGVLLPLLIAAVIKTAQGSTTVAIITTASLVAPILPELDLDTATAKALCVTAIGAGAMVVSHANDSYFWVVSQFSDMKVEEAYRLQSLGTLVQGGTAALLLLVASLFLL